MENGRKSTSSIQALQAQPMERCHMAITWTKGPTKQGNTLSTNKERVHGSMGPPTCANVPSSQHTHPYTLRGPHGGDQRRDGAWGTNLGSIEPKVGPLTSIFHVSIVTNLEGITTTVRGQFRVPSTTINRGRGLEYRHTSSLRFLLGLVLLISHSLLGR
jgi:hypothetical protein